MFILNYISYLHGLIFILHHATITLLAYELQLFNRYKLSIKKMLIRMFI